MNILFLSFYYQPDLCAGSFRATALISALLKRVPQGTQIELITTMPNRYGSFISKVPEFEAFGNLTVRRIPLPAHQSGMLDQSQAFLAFVVSAFRHTRHRKYDLVFATSSRLMTAVLGAAIARWGNVPLYLDIRDIFADTIKDVFPGRFASWVMPFIAGLEQFALKGARKVNLVSGGFQDYFTRRFPHISYSFFTNGVDPEFIEAFPDRVARTAVVPEFPLTVLYAGNMGEGQGLHSIIPTLAKNMTGRVRFRLIGDGGRRLELERAIASAECDNVVVLDPVNRESLIKEYRNADVLFLHLNDYEAFKKVLPSKIFEYAATGKPIWAGVGGFSAQFLNNEVSNVAVFSPCNAAAAEMAFSRLDMRVVSRLDFIARFSREAICDEMAADILGVVAKSE